MGATLLPAEETTQAASPRSWTETQARDGLIALFARLREGEVCLVENDRRQTFGCASAQYPLRATLTVHDPAFYTRLAAGGSIAAGETYVDGLWSTDDLPALLCITLRNWHVFTPVDGWKAWLVNLGHRLWHFIHANTRRGSRVNIAAHYDVGNDFYRLWLDDSLMYSAAIFERESTSLEDASYAKLERICQKLDLGPADHVLEIGAGWGGFAIHAAKHYGCRVTTTTISRQQFEFASQRIKELGLEDRVDVLLQDYRDLRGCYDKLVSIEMIEAVGERFLGTYFERCSQLLKPSGMMLLQSITIAEQAFRGYRGSVDFIQRYIFPGGFLPSVALLTQRLAHFTDLRLYHFEDFGSHYARTLRHWRSRLLNHAESVRALGYSDQFLRMWEYYLAYCEAGFSERNTGVVQMLLLKPSNRRAPILPPLR